MNKLTEEQKRILLEKGTEAPNTGKYLNNKEKGMYICAQCDSELFTSDTKFDSKSGWPSFWDTFSSNNIELLNDDSHGLNRVEVVCSKCKGHLGHLFDDAYDQPKNQRYCINSACLNFIKKD